MCAYTHVYTCDHAHHTAHTHAFKPTHNVTFWHAAAVKHQLARVRATHACVRVTARTHSHNTQHQHTSRTELVEFRRLREAGRAALDQKRSDALRQNKHRSRATLSSTLFGLAASVLA
jgi:hypothetical protein